MSECWSVSLEISRIGSSFCRMSAAHSPSQCPNQSALCLGPSISLNTLPRHHKSPIRITLMNVSLNLTSLPLLNWHRTSSLAVTPPSLPLKLFLSVFRFMAVNLCMNSYCSWHCTPAWHYTSFLTRHILMSRLSIFNAPASPPDFILAILISAMIDI